MAATGARNHRATIRNGYSRHGVMAAHAWIGGVEVDGHENAGAD
jgi:hypothetical protein